MGVWQRSPAGAAIGLSNHDLRANFGAALPDWQAGVRCDMAMLVMNDVFARTWGSRIGATPDSDYWPSVIAEVRQAHPGFVFLAEAYWDLEWTLQQQGFNYCYDPLAGWGSR